MLAIALLLPLAAPAHQMQVAITTVSFNTRAESIEVIHRFYTHDTEHVMSVIAGRQADMTIEQAVQQRFGQYVSENFHLFDQANAELPLALVGVELEGEVIFVYQETSLPAYLVEISVLNSALLDTLPAQVNTVNIECGEEFSTLEFSAAQKTVRPASIDFSACLP